MTNNQIDSVSGLAINCHNCIHCERSDLDSSYDRCRKAGGKFCVFVHQFPINNGHICRNYSSWAPRQKTILELISDRIRKMLTQT